jgi:hypothetical protein
MRAALLLFAAAAVADESPPEPPVSVKCEYVLNKVCVQAKGSQAACDACVEHNAKALKKGKCTQAEELKFCDGSGSGPIPPAPLDKRCEKLLKKDCKEYLVEPRPKDESQCALCTANASATEPDVECTTRDRFQFCE